MKPYNVQLLALVVTCSLAISSCGSTTVVSSGDVAIFKEINERARTDIAKICLIDSAGQLEDCYYAHELFVSLDSARWVDWLGARRTAPIESVDRIMFTDHWAGALYGLGIGVGIGATAGLFLGASLSDSMGGGIELTGIIVAGGAGYLAVPGLLIGLLYGKDTTFELGSQ